MRTPSASNGNARYGVRRRPCSDRKAASCERREGDPTVENTHRSSAANPIRELATYAGWGSRVEDARCTGVENDGVHATTTVRVGGDVRIGWKKRIIGEMHRRKDAGL